MKINKLDIIAFSFIFFIVTVLGIQLHEITHYIVATYLGFKPILHHSSVSFQVKENLCNLYYLRNEFKIVVSGPMQTITFGFIGLSILLFRINKTKKITFNKIDWICVFLSLFLLRQSFIFIIYFFKKIVLQQQPTTNDEFKIALFLGLNPDIFIFFSGLLFSFICVYIFFFLIPLKYRFNFILGSIFGTLSSYLIWTLILGKIILK